MPSAGGGGAHSSQPASSTQSVSEHQVVNKPKDELWSLAGLGSQQLPNFLEKWRELAGLPRPLVHHIR